MNQPTSAGASLGSTAEGGTSSPQSRPVAPLLATRRGLGVGEVRLTGGFWGVRQETNAWATIQHCLTWMERLGWIANFDAVASGNTRRERRGWQFSDSEIYKLLEAIAWELARTDTRPLAATFDRLVARVAAAQDEDGYLNTCYGHRGQAERYSDLERGHELYCIGHLLQAAVARWRTRGEDDLLVRVARRAADHVCREFGPQGRQAICGHPEIEVGLAELGRALDEPRYTEQARLFVERRGRGVLTPIPLLGSSYFQDDIPVREADVWRGHAVRALYLAAGAVDVAVDTHDDELLDAVVSQWERSVQRRTYLTGGMGSRHQDEGFGDDWELPPDRAYCETCAGVASTMVSWRLFLATGDVRYADLMERTYYNIVATSPRADGRAFFYANPLQQRVPANTAEAGDVNARAEGGLRAPWFDVSCCPTNVARTLASWQTNVATVDGDELTIVQHAPCEIDVELDAGGHLSVRVETRYPADGAIQVTILDAPERKVTLRLRVPEWGHGATLIDAAGQERLVAPGWATVCTVLRAGDTVRLNVPVEPRFTWPDPRIDALRGTVAVEKGPLVLCLESADLPAGVTIENVRVDVGGRPRLEGDGALLRARTVRHHPTEHSSLPYFSVRPTVTLREEFAIALVPYHRWAEHAPGTMRVFLPTI
ncbi:glycoside hydrolase family 127 protein [Cellulosimicrobium cellulans]|uniref:glycoside hydrolase family 127 protein n=1 Tax=Cellulosimicrobium cellulans TaxID=1710 RepID=UPI001966102A|nr:beta-L-arabinofuranosidase domain-containing protein [Cellulosimicrobium cellulans]MBN0038588.1 glycoside hydrolase family 127 protein [Cellulosimicrobium cellulans]